EYSKHVARLRNFPAVQWSQFRKNSLGTSLFASRWRDCLDRLRVALAVVAFAEARVLGGNSPIVVERRPPQKTRVGHHAGGNRANFVGVAACSAASFRCNAQVARIHKFYVLGGFLQPFGEHTFQYRAAISERRVPRVNVRLVLGGGVFSGMVVGPGRNLRGRIPAMAIAAPELNG